MKPDSLQQTVLWISTGCGRKVSACALPSNLSKQQHHFASFFPTFVVLLPSPGLILLCFFLNMSNFWLFLFLCLRLKFSSLTFEAVPLLWFVLLPTGADFPGWDMACNIWCSKHILTTNDKWGQNAFYTGMCHSLNWAKIRDSCKPKSNGRITNRLRKSWR